MPDVHAILAPSAAKRWLTCTPSARLEAALPEKTSVYAEEGTIAHAVAECLLHFYLGTGQIAVYDDPWSHYEEFALAQTDLTNLYVEAADKGFDFKEILETVHDGYVAVIWPDWVRAKAEDPAAVLLVEQRVDLSDYVPESFGSSDAIIIWDRRMNVYDLKYGRGVKVSAVNNPQMRLYALGALLGPGETYEIETVRATIVQPRLHAVSSETLRDIDLRIWANVTVAPAAKRAFAGEGEFVPGDHCEFCRAKAQCFALLEYTRRIVRTDSEPKLMTAEDIAAVLPTLATIEGWTAAVRAYAMDVLAGGGSIPGWKLVEGRSTRKILRDYEARQILKEAGFQPKDYDKVELRGITDLTKLVGGAKVFNAMLGHLVEKQPGKPALAPEDDPRAAYSPAASAEAAFNEML
jgi:uncharacterized protein (UPF0179 family)